jgi:hypothetical protein
MTLIERKRMRATEISMVLDLTFEVEGLGRKPRLQDLDLLCP